MLIWGRSGAPSLPYGFSAGYALVELTYQADGPAFLQFGNGNGAYGACLSCPTAPCISFAEDEIACSSLVGFPSDLTASTCAADAIRLNLTDGVPSIDSDRCIGCGICASRCPVGAIFIKDGQGAYVANQAKDPAYALAVSETHEEYVRAREILDTVPRKGVLAMESDANIARSEKMTSEAFRREGDRFPVLHVRNLLVAAGQGASMRRRGVNHMRMDLVLSAPGWDRGLVEVEFGLNAAIESPRDVLDGAAVLHSRHGWMTGGMTLMIAKDQLPNERSGYWNVISDISKVLNLKIGTITTLALQLAIWLRRPLPASSVFYVDRSNRDYRGSVLEQIAGRTLTLSKERRSSIEPAK